MSIAGTPPARRLVQGPLFELKRPGTTRIDPSPSGPALRRRRAKRKSKHAYRALMLSGDCVQYPRTDRLPYLNQSRLIQRAQAGDTQARNTIWMHNARLVYSVLGRFPVRDHIIADAMQEGQLGVLRAIELFDVERYLAFSTYASHWIRNRSKRLAVSASFATSIPAYLWVDLIRFHTHIAQAADRNDWFDQCDAWRSRDNESYFRAARLHAIACPEPLTPDCPLHADHADPLERLIAREEIDETHRQFRLLEEREAQIMLLRYRESATDAATLRAIGDAVGLTRERVRQLILDAHRSIHDRLARRGMLDEHEESVSW